MDRLFVCFFYRKMSHDHHMGHSMDMDTTTTHNHMDMTTAHNHGDMTTAHDHGNMGTTDGMNHMDHMDMMKVSMI